MAANNNIMNNRYETATAKMVRHHVKPVSCFSGMIGSNDMTSNLSLIPKNVTTILYMVTIFQIYTTVTSSSENRISGIWGLLRMKK